MSKKAVLNVKKQGLKRMAKEKKDKDIYV